MASKKVLFVGFSCMDFVNVVNEFPTEDSEQGILNYYWQRGGNAINSTTVTYLLSIPCEYFGVLATKGPEANWMINDLKEAGICVDHCVKESVQTSVSTSIINVTTGSRTILYNCRDYRFPSVIDFNEKFEQDFTAFSWIHFELMQNSDDILAMIKVVTRYNERCQATGRLPVIISAEIESPTRDNIDSIMSLADVVFISKDVAKSRGCACAENAVTNLYHCCKPGATLICAWGDQGAALCRKDLIFMAPAKTDIQAIDTLGAGDTFNAGFISYAIKTGRIHSLTDEDLKSALTFACQLAGYKCSIFGYAGLKSFPFIVKD